MLFNWTEDAEVVGGNSTYKYESLFDIVDEWGAKKIGDLAKEEVVGKIFGETAKEFVGPLGTFYTASQY